MSETSEVSVIVCVTYVGKLKPKLHTKGELKKGGEGVWGGIAQEPYFFQ